MPRQGPVLEFREQMAERIGIEGLREVLFESGREGPPPVRGSGQRDEKCSRVLSEQAARKLVTVHAGQVDIHQDEIGSNTAENLERLPALVRDTYSVVPVPEQDRDAVCGIAVVVDDQDRERPGGT